MESKIALSAILLGPPAAGKGTVAEVLQSTLHHSLVQPGNIYRRLKDEDSETGRYVNSFLLQGHLVPDELTDRVMLEEAVKLTEGGATGIIFDGYPRTVAQLDYLQEHYDVGAYIHFDAPYDVLECAAVNRRQCIECAHVMSMVKPDTWCDCKHPSRPAWRHRADDTPELFAKRYEVYQTQTEPIVALVQDRPNYLKLELHGNEDVMAQVLNFLGGVSVRS